MHNSYVIFVQLLSQNYVFFVVYVCMTVSTVTLYNNNSVIRLLLIFIAVSVELSITVEIGRSYEHFYEISGYLLYF